MSTLARLITADELLEMPEDETQWCELIDGEIVPMSPPGFEHGIVAQNVSWLLTQHVRRRGLGLVTAAETGFIVSRNPDTVLAPDGGFVRQARLDVIGVPRAYFPEAPSLVFEVVSPRDRVGEVARKMWRWFAAGVEMVWVVDPVARTVAVHRSLENPRLLTEKDTLSGEPVVPGFECRVADFFAGI
jgi:Uma2 family endonuclease